MGRGEICLLYRFENREYRYSIFQSTDFGLHWAQRPGYSFKPETGRAPVR